MVEKIVAGEFGRKILNQILVISILARVDPGITSCSVIQIMDENEREKALVGKIVAGELGRKILSQNLVTSILVRVDLGITPSPESNWGTKMGVE